MSVFVVDVDTSYRANRIDFAHCTWDKFGMGTMYVYVVNYCTRPPVFWATQYLRMFDKYMRRTKSLNDRICHMWVSGMFRAFTMDEVLSGQERLQKRQSQCLQDKIGSWRGRWCSKRERLQCVHKCSLIVFLSFAPRWFLKVCVCVCILTPMLDHNMKEPLGNEKLPLPSLPHS